MKSRYFLIVLFLLSVAILTGAGCHSAPEKGGPKDLLDRYFSSAIKQDYATTYGCYYGAYREKVDRDEYIRRRREASVLQAYRVKSVTENGDVAQASVELTFGPSQKLKRTQPIMTAVKEELVRENGEWKVKVW